MLLHELLSSRRQEVLEACAAERHHPEGLDQLASYITEYFDDIVRLLRPGSQDLEPPSFIRQKGPAQIVGMTPAMVRVRVGIDQLSHRSRTAVLILGDVGTGRRHCALALHTATYPEGEFFELGSSTSLVELERRIAGLRSLGGAAPGLTIFLPEMAHAALEVQRYLADLLKLPLLKYRLIGSSSEGLPKLSREGRLLPDLASAFSSKLMLPALSARANDIAALATHFAEQLAARGSAPPLTFSAAAIEAMQRYSWPGNVAELARLVERLWHEQGSVVVEKADLVELGETAGVAFSLPATGIVFSDLERVVLTQALALAENNQSRAAILLGMTRDQLRYRMAKFEISSAGARGSSAGKKR